jgi:RNA polymerase sigma-70 factor (ECF subfamily)
MSNLKESQDAELVKRAIGGEQEAFKVLMDRYIKVAGAIAFSVVGDFHTATDVIQEAFWKAYTQLSNLHEPARFKTYLADTVKTTALDHLRRKGLGKRGRVVTLSEFPEEQALAPSAAEVQVPYIEKSELQEKVMRLVNELPPQYREVFVLKHIEDLSYREIAQILRVTPASVEARLFRARKLLRKNLDKML